MKETNQKQAEIKQKIESATLVTACESAGFRAEIMIKNTAKMQSNHGRKRA